MINKTYMGCNLQMYRGIRNSKYQALLDHPLLAVWVIYAISLLTSIFSLTKG
jgi:hypothetical protein